MRVLAITRGAPPIENYLTVGSAIRAYSILKYFRRAGAECYFLSNSSDLQGIESADGIHVVRFDLDRELPFIIKNLKPDFIFVSVSELMQFIPEERESIIFLDLFAHRFTESLYENVDISVDLFLRLDSLTKADYFITLSSRQRDFVSSLLILVGLRDVLDRVLIVPPLPLERPLERKIPDEFILVAGGYSWPWIDDRGYINEALDLFEEKGRGEVRIYGGRFVIESRVDEFEYSYRDSRRLKREGVLPYRQLIEGYSKASAGLLCFEKNIERYFSYNFRAADYLFSGLPVIVNDYLQISELIKKYDAGWVIKGLPDFRETLERILSDNEIIMHKSDNVATLVMQEFDVTKCIEAVVNVMNNPRRLKKVDGLINNLIKIVDRYVKEGIEQADLLNAVKRLEVENTRLAERIASKDSEILRLNNEKTEILRESGWLKDEVKRLNDEILRLKDELLRVRTEKERLERENGELNAKVTELMRKNGFLEDEKLRLTNEINVRSDEILKIKNEILELKKSISTLESEIQKRDQIIQDLKKKEAELEGIKSLPLYKLYKKVF